MNRVVRVALAQNTSAMTVFGWPLIILATSFVFNLVFFGLMGDDLDGQRITGGVASIYLVHLVLCTQLATQGFSFAVGLNVTRRTFLLASGLVIGLQGLLYGTILYGLAVVEQLTNGWGIELAYFTLLPSTATYSPLSIVIFAVPMLLFGFTGLFLGAINKRWGTTGVLWLIVLATIVLGTAAVLLTWSRSWAPIGRWIASQSEIGLVAGWTLVPVLLLALGSFGVLRRAVP